MLGACAADGGAESLCSAADGTVVALDAPGAVARWEAIEAAAPSSMDEAARVLVVVARQIEMLGPDRDFSTVAALAMTHRVTEAFQTVVTALAQTCGVVAPRTLEPASTAP